MTSSKTNLTFKQLLVDVYNEIQNMIGRDKLHPIEVVERHGGESVVLGWEPADEH